MFAPIYKCYDVGELIQRKACLVHMRRPFYKLKDVSEDAMRMLKLFDAIFHEDKLVDLLEHRWQPAAVGVWA